MYSILRPDEDVLVVDLRSGNSHKLTRADRTDEVGDLAWSGDGKTLFYRTIDPVTYRETVHRWAARATSGSEVFSADEALARLSSSGDGRRVSFTAMGATHPVDAYVYDTAEHKRSAVTHLNPQLDKFEFVAPQMFEFQSEDGDKSGGIVVQAIGFGAGAQGPGGDLRV